jgi:hypothetical protein
MMSVSMPRRGIETETISPAIPVEARNKGHEIALAGAKTGEAEQESQQRENLLTQSNANKGGLSASRSKRLQVSNAEAHSAIESAFQRPLRDPADSRLDLRSLAPLPGGLETVARHVNPMGGRIRAPILIGRWELRAHDSFSSQVWRITSSFSPCPRRGHFVRGCAGAAGVASNWIMAFASL